MHESESCRTFDKTCLLNNTPISSDEIYGCFSSSCLFFLFPDKNSDSQNAFEDLAHYEFLAHLRKASTSESLLDHLNHNGKAAVYHPSSGHDELPPAIWSPGAQHRSPDGAGTLTRGTTAML